MASFVTTLVPALGFFAVGVVIAWFIWGRNGSDNA
jgi:hypothetical protein